MPGKTLANIYISWGTMTEKVMTECKKLNDGV